MDIAYVPMARGFVFLTAVLDWYSRKVRVARGILGAIPRQAGFATNGAPVTPEIRFDLVKATSGIFAVRQVRLRPAYADRFTTACRSTSWASTFWVGFSVSR